MEKPQNSTQANFMETVDEIRKAEQEAEKIKLAAIEKSDQILGKGKENAMKASTETEKEVTELKNALFRKESEQIEQEINKILDKAKKDSEGVRKQGLDKKQCASLLKGSLFAD